MILFKEIAPFAITATLIICTLIAIKIKKKDILTTDGIFAVVGFGFGLFATFLNLIYTSKELFLLSPLIAITCLLYLQFRDKILTSSIDFNLDFNHKKLKVINILYWICILVTVISYHQAPPYYRPPIFFIGISFGVALLGLEIISSKFKDDFNVFAMISKILLISLILRMSAYFISPYPIGGDSWAHVEYIRNFLQSHHVMVASYPSETGVGVYYCEYPIAHLLACATSLIGNISIRESMFCLGGVLTLSTMFVYLIVKKVSGNVNLALFSMLLINFADFHIEWSYYVIPMSFGIAIYTILIYLTLKKGEKHQLLYTSILISYLFIITWTHTIASLIALVSVICLYLGSFIYSAAYGKGICKEFGISLAFCIIFVVLLLFHWMDPNYPFFEGVMRGLVNTLSKEAGFLGGQSRSNITGTLGELINIPGFLVYVFFGIIGSLYYLSRKHANKTTVSLIFMIFILYFIRYGFPILGMQNIIPSRWPAFIYVSFVLFVGVGLFVFLSMLKRKNQKISFALFILFTSSFLMITNSVSNVDSPIYGECTNMKYSWTESEMTLFKNLNDTYDGEIVADVQTGIRPFKTYLVREKTTYYPLTTEGGITWAYMQNKVVIWTKDSLNRPVGVGGYGGPLMLLGEDFKLTLDENFSCMYDTGNAKAYI